MPPLFFMPMPLAAFCGLNSPRRGHLPTLTAAIHRLPE